MKFKTNAKILKQNLKSFNKIISKKNVIKFAAYDNKLTLVICCEDFYLKSIIDCEIEAEGECLIIKENIDEILKNFDSETIFFEIDNNLLKIVDIDIVYKINLTNYEYEQHFSEPDFIKKTYIKICDIYNFKQVLEDTLFAISINENENRLFLKGLFLDINQNYQKAASSNGHILTCKKINIDKYVQDFSQILEIKTINFLQNILKDNDKIELFFNGYDCVNIIINNIQLFSKTIDGTFPEYQKVLEQHSCDIEVDIDQKKFIFLIKKMQTIMKKKLFGNVCYCDFDFVNQKLQLSSEDEQFISYINFVSNINEGYIKTGLNINYLNKIIARQNNQFKIKLTNGTNPILIGDDNYISVIMPLRI